MEKKLKTKNNKNKVFLTVITFLLILSIVFNIYLVNINKKNIIQSDENIVFFGDSITNQYEVEKFYPKHKVINSGFGGNKTEDLLFRIENDVYKYNPSKVFILIGINDIANNIPDDDIINNLQIIINGIKNNRKSAKLYVESIYPLNHKKLTSLGFEFYCKDYDNKMIMNLNERIKEICNESGVTYIDVYSKLTDENGDLNDLYTIEGLHLNNLGYLKVTSVLEKYID